MLTITERPLTPAEVQSLDGRLDHARRESRVALVKAGGASLLVCGVLGLLTLFASQSAVWVVVLFWSALAFTLTVWTGLPRYHTMRHQVASPDDAIRASRARITRIQSSRVVEFEEKEDEGGCYAFEVDTSICLFIVGQEFHGDDFTNSDFSIVELLGTRDRTRRARAGQADRARLRIDRRAYSARNVMVGSPPRRCTPSGLKPARRIRPIDRFVN